MEALWWDQLTVWKLQNFCFFFLNIVFFLFFCFEDSFKERPVSSIFLMGCVWNLERADWLVNLLNRPVGVFSVKLPWNDIFFAVFQGFEDGDGHALATAQWIPGYLGLSTVLTTLFGCCGEGVGRLGAIFEIFGPCDAPKTNLWPRS